MTEPLAQATALLKHFATEVCPAAVVTGTCLGVPAVDFFVVTVVVSPVADGVRVEMDMPPIHTHMSADDIARVGGMLIQISNLVRQIRALAGGNVSDSRRVEPAA